MNENSHKAVNAWLKMQKDDMCHAVFKWAGINSHTHNEAGLKKMFDTLEEAFSSLGGNFKKHQLHPIEKYNEEGIRIKKALGSCLQVDKHLDAKHKVLLLIHMDTVYPADSIQQPVSMNDEKIEGPGVADAKGGIAVMLWTLKAIEKFAPGVIGWTVLLNSDEEIGSPGSLPLLRELAPKYDLGMVYEPSLPNGDIVSERKGSGNFQIIIKGRSAHAGRDHHLGRNAITSLSRCINKLDALNSKWSGCTVNVGTIKGGTALNVVPDFALGGFNVRFSKPEDQKIIYDTIKEIVDEAGNKEGYSSELVGNFFSPPKLLDAPHKRLLDDIITCAKELGLNISHKPSGGVCDGNKLTGFGLTNIDTLGVQGGNIHSPNEYCLKESLWQRAELSTRFLLKIGSDEINPKERYG
jgi:glutamate carboxypeptidase